MGPYLEMVLVFENLSVYFINLFYTESLMMAIFENNPVLRWFTRLVDKRTPLLKKFTVFYYLKFAFFDRQVFFFLILIGRVIKAHGLSKLGIFQIFCERKDLLHCVII